MTLYKRIAMIRNRYDADDIADELMDRFGDMPDAVDNLLRIAIIRALAVDLGIKQITESGDLAKTIKDLTGQAKEDLQVIKTVHDLYERYDFVWTAAGEQGHRLGRAVILDDGEYHYCMSVLRDAGDSMVVWQDVFSSFTLA